jgi:hypothetical protein
MDDKKDSCVWRSWRKPVRDRDLPALWGDGGRVGKRRERRKVVVGKEERKAEGGQDGVKSWTRAELEKPQAPQEAKRGRRRQDQVPAPSTKLRVRKRGRRFPQRTDGSADAAGAASDKSESGDWSLRAGRCCLGSSFPRTVAANGSQPARPPPGFPPPPSPALWNQLNFRFESYNWLTCDGLAQKTVLTFAVVGVGQ